MVAVRQARSSHRSAAAAQEAVELDRERLDTEQTPQLIGEYSGKAGGHGSLLLTNDGPIATDRLHLKVVGGPHGEPPKVHFDNNGDPTREIARTGLRIGEQTH